MSQQNVGHVVDRLLTDEELRLRFAVDPFEAISELHVHGFELTSDEIDVFVRSGAQVWFCEKQTFAGPAH